MDKDREEYTLLELTLKVQQIERTLAGCCTSKVIVERELAHRSLNEALDKLTAVVSKLQKIEETQIGHANLGKDVAVLKKDASRLKIGIAVGSGVFLAIQFLGLTSNIAKSITG